MRIWIKVTAVLLACCVGVAAGAAETDSKQLQQFARADQAVQQVRMKYIKALAREQENKGRSDWSQAAMQIEMRQVIEVEGLTLDTFNRLAEKMAKDEAFRQQVETLEGSSAD